MGRGQLEKGATQKRSEVGIGQIGKGRNEKGAKWQRDEMGLNWGGGGKVGRGDLGRGEVGRHPGKTDSPPPLPSFRKTTSGKRAIPPLWILTPLPPPSNLPPRKLPPSAGGYSQEKDAPTRPYTWNLCVMRHTYSEVADYLSLEILWSNKF